LSREPGRTIVALAITGERKMATRISLAAFALLFAAFSASAQQFPSRRVTVLGGFGPASPPEIELRLMAPFLSKLWGQPVVVENKIGAGGLISLEEAVKSPPDGYTLVYGVAAMATYKLLVKDLRFDPLTDLVPISIYADYPGGFWTNDKVPARTIEEFVAYAKANAGKLNYGAVGRSTTVFTVEFLKGVTGIEMPPVTYKGGGDVVTAMIRNEVQLVNLTSSELDKGNLKNGLRPLLTIGDQRAPAFPDVPAAAEKGWQIPRNGWYALFAPRGTPRPVIDTIATGIRQYLQSPENKERAAKAGIYIPSSGPDQLRQQMERDAKAWATIAERIGIKPE
jgi:tripartite-type tricarboxylate transporter receptor subunit TctC